MRTIWIALPVVLVIGWLDFMTGRDIGLSLLYLLPIAISAWRGRAADAARMARPGISDRCVQQPRFRILRCSAGTVTYGQRFHFQL